MKNSIKFLPALLLISLLLAGCAGRKDSLSVRAIPLDKALEAESTAS